MTTTNQAVVAVIGSRKDLERALSLRVMPDFFELRLDAFAGEIDGLWQKIEKFKAPLIITARHPAEADRLHLIREPESGRRRATRHRSKP